MASARPTSHLPWTGCCWYRYGFHPARGGQRTGPRRSPPPPTSAGLGRAGLGWKRSSCSEGKEMLRNQLNSNLVVLIVQCTFIAIQKINVHVFAKIAVGGPRGRKGCPGAVRTKEHHTTVGVDSRGASRSKNGPAPPPVRRSQNCTEGCGGAGREKKIGSKISGEKEMGVKIAGELRFVPPQATVRAGGGDRYWKRRFLRPSIFLSDGNLRFFLRSSSASAFWDWNTARRV